jgi:hypothetical protein
MIAYLCETDGTVYVISDADPDVNLLPAVAYCPGGCGKKLHAGKTPAGASPSTEPIGLKKIVLTAQQFYQACMGLGLPDQRVANVERVRVLLSGAEITNLKVSQSINSERTLIDEMTVKTTDKRVLTFHFAQSVQGALIYKITEL